MQLVRQGGKTGRGAPRGRTGLREQQVCKLLEVDARSSATGCDLDPLPDCGNALIELAKQKPRFGYRRLGVLLPSEVGRPARSGTTDPPAKPGRALGRARAEAEALAANGSTRPSRERIKPPELDVNSANHIVDCLTRQSAKPIA